MSSKRSRVKRGSSKVTRPPWGEPRYVPLTDLYALARAIQKRGKRMSNV